MQTINISRDNMGVRLGKEDREIWPTPPVKVKAPPSPTEF